MRTRRTAAVVLAYVLVTLVHLAVGRATHAEHLAHIVFGAVYLLPVLMAALWLGARPGLAAAVASALAYALHARVVWASDRMLLASALVSSAVLLGVGAVTAFLVDLRDRERSRHAQAERRVQREAIVEAIASLSRALRARDDGTAAHCERVAGLAARVAVRLGLPPERVELVRLAGLVHDVGKIGVRDDVLLKHAALTADERARIERHPSFAAEMLAPLRGTEELAAIVLAHHEASDGSGYPRHLAGDAVPLEARIVRVADVFDALTAERPYKDAMAPHEALATMKRQERSFDPATLAAIEAVVGAAREHRDA